MTKNFFIISYALIFSISTYAKNCEEDYKPVKLKRQKRAQAATCAGSIAGTVILGSIMPFTLLGTVPATGAIAAGLSRSTIASKNDKKITSILEYAREMSQGQKLFGDIIKKNNASKGQLAFEKFFEKLRDSRRERTSSSYHRKKGGNISRGELAELLIQASENGVLCPGRSRYLKGGFYIRSHDIRRMIRNGSLKTRVEEIIGRPLDQNSSVGNFNSIKAPNDFSDEEMDEDSENEDSIEVAVESSIDEEEALGVSAWGFESDDEDEESDY